MAGVVGSPNSGVSESTREIFLEAAFFDPVSVRKTSLRLKANTDAAYRFARGVDPELVVRALDLATDLLAQNQESLNYLGDTEDLISDMHFPKARTLSVRFSYLKSRVGKELSDSVMRKILIELQAGGRPEARGSRDLRSGELSDSNGASSDVFHFSVPSYRFDLVQEADLVEEIARLDSYLDLPETFPPLTHYPEPHSLCFQKQKVLAQLGVELGLNQNFHLMLVSPEEEKKNLGAYSWIHRDPVVLRNPLSQEESALRRSLLLPLLKNLIRTQSTGLESWNCFEVGPVFYKNISSQSENPREKAGDKFTRSLDSGVHYVQDWSLALGLGGQELQEGFFTLKSKVEWILQQIQIPFEFKLVREVPSRTVPEFMHPGRSLWLESQGQCIGFVAELHPQWLEGAKIRGSFAVAEIDLSLWMEDLVSRIVPNKFKPYSILPSITRDISIEMKADAAVGGVLDWVQSSALPFLADVKLVEVYHGDKVAQGRKSVTIRYRFQSFKETLQDEGLQAPFNEHLQSLLKKFDAQLRT